MNYLALIISGLVIALFLALFLAAARSRREKMARQEKRVSALGFRPLEKAPPELTDKLSGLRLSDQRRQFQLDHVYHRADFDQDFYLVDVVDSSDEQDMWLGPETLVVVSPHLALPRFTLISLPEMEDQGIMVDLAEKMLESAFSWMAGSLGVERIDFPSSPDFETRYVVFGSSQAAVRSLFTPSLIDYLMGVTLPLTLEGEGDLFAAGLSYTSSRKRKPMLNDLYREVIDLARVLKRGS